MIFWSSLSIGLDASAVAWNRYNPKKDTPVATAVKRNVNQGRMAKRRTENELLGY